MQNKDIEFDGDDLIKSVESFVDFCEKNPAFVDYINNRLKNSEATPLFYSKCLHCNNPLTIDTTLTTAELICQNCQTTKFDKQ